MPGPAAAAGRPSDPLVGRVVSHYRVLEHLGAGGMGAVYVALDEVLGRRVALKAIRIDQLDSERLRQRFQREARLLSRIDHANICRIHDYISQGEQDFLVLELIEGHTLKEHAADGLESGEVLRIAAEICAALTEAHGQGILHRDLKPANVMVTGAGVVKVLDFGLARPVASASGGVAKEPDDDSAESKATDETTDWSSIEVTLTERGVVTGTLAYMSPEQASGRRLSTASDMYSLGLMLHELACGERAYPKGLAPAALWELVKDGRALPLRSQDRELDELVESLKDPIPSKRPTAVETARSIERLRTRGKRRLVRGLVAAGLALVAAGIGKYVLDLGRERNRALEAEDRAVVARDEAERRRGQAEELMGFMVTDLRERLDAVGRLDVLANVEDRLRAYLDAPDAELTETERLFKARMLYQMGETCLKRNDLERGRELFEQATATARELVAVDPDNLDWLMELGASQFHVGWGLLEQGERERAEKWFEAYRETAERGCELSGGARVWRLEVHMAEVNLGALRVEQGELIAALEHFERSEGICRGLLEQAPEDAELMLELADTLSWLGKTLLGQRSNPSRSRPAVERARAYFLEEAELRARLLAGQPRNAPWRSRAATAEFYLGEVAASLDDHAQALVHFQRARDSSRELHDLDPANAEWRAELALHLAWTAEAHSKLGELDQAQVNLEQARGHFEALALGDPANPRWRNELTRCHAQEARLGLASSE